MDLTQELDRVQREALIWQRKVSRNHINLIFIRITGITNIDNENIKSNNGISLSLNLCSYSVKPINDYDSCKAISKPRFKFDKIYMCDCIFTGHISSGIEEKHKQRKVSGWRNWTDEERNPQDGSKKPNCQNTEQNHNFCTTGIPS